MLNPKTTALVIVDLQHGMLALPLTPYDDTTIVQRCMALGQAAAAQATIVLTSTNYSGGYADRQNQPADLPMKLPAEGLPDDWAKLVPEVLALPARIHITKRQQSAFFGTELDLQLRRRGIATVVLCGVATNFGVEATARDAHNLNYAVVIADDACSSVMPTLHEFAITKILPRIARVRGSSAIIAALGATDPAGL